MNDPCQGFWSRFTLSLHQSHNINKKQQWHCRPTLHLDSLQSDEELWHHGSFNYFVSMARKYLWRGKYLGIRLKHKSIKQRNVTCNKLLWSSLGYSYKSNNLHKTMIIFQETVGLIGVTWRGFRPKWKKNVVKIAKKTIWKVGFINLWIIFHLIDIVMCRLVTLHIKIDISLWHNFSKFGNL